MTGVVGLLVFILAIVAIVVVVKGLASIGSRTEPKQITDTSAVQENIILNRAMREIMVNPEQAQLYVAAAYDEIGNLSKQIEKGR